MTMQPIPGRNRETEIRTGAVVVSVQRIIRAYPVRIKKENGEWHVYQEFCGASHHANKNLLVALFRFYRDCLKYKTWRIRVRQQQLDRIYGDPYRHKNTKLTQ